MEGRAQKTGTFIMAITGLSMLLFVIGALRKSYLALALPVTMAMTALTGLALWVGWIMMNMEDEPGEPPVTVVD